MTPVDWAAVGLATTSTVTIIVKWLLPGLRALQAPAGNGSERRLEARVAGGEAATLLGEVRENRRRNDEIHELVIALAHGAEHSEPLLAQLTELAHKADGRMTAIEEATQAMSRMLQLHTGLLDKTALQMDAVHAHLPKKRGKR